MKEQKPAYITWLKENRNKAYLFIAFHIVFAIVLRYCYPYMDLTSDTGGYINAIHYGFKQGSMRPLGYSYFLNFSAFGSGFGAQPVFWLQYITYCLSMFFFYSSTSHLFNISNKYISFAYLLVTILFVPGLYATNILMADSLFTSLTIVLITLCLWWIQSGNKYIFIIVILFLAATVSLRYIGFIYPAFIIVAILLTYRKSMQTVVYSLVIILLAYAYVEYVKHQTKKDRDVEVFSSFGGWQKANNALHVIPYIDLSKSTVNTNNTEILRIDTIVRITYPYNKQYYPDSWSVSYHMMWLDSVPLTLAQNYYIYKEPQVDFFTIWNRCGVLYSEYADLLMRDHFPEYFRYYLVNNAIRAFHPPEEILTQFPDTTYTPITNEWFGWAINADIQPRHDLMRPFLRNLSGYYSCYWILFLVANGYFIMQFRRKNISSSSTRFRLFILLFFFTWLYALASIYAAPVNLRFLLPVRVVIVGLVFAFIQHFVSMDKDTRNIDRFR